MKVAIGQGALDIESTAFDSSHALEGNTGLPRSGSNVFDTVGVLEHSLGLLKSLASSFRETKEDVNGHGEAKDAKDDVRLVGDVLEGRRHEVGEREVEDPVGGGGEGNTTRSNWEWEDLTNYDPGTWTPSGGEEAVMLSVEARLLACMRLTR